MKNIKTIIKNVSLLAVLACGLTSCSDSFLEVTPKGKLIADQTADYDLLLNNKALLELFFNGQVQAYLGDELDAINPYYEAGFLRSKRLFSYTDVIYERNENAEEVTDLMKNLYTYNKIINEVMDSQNGSEAQKKAIRAEALVGRAWANLLLINYYGKPYTDASAATDPGFPIILNSDVTQTKFTRASVGEVYELILNDLTTAIPDLPKRLTHRLRASKSAGEGILAKAYIYMGKFDKALPLLESAIANIANAGIPVKLIDQNEAFAPGGIYLPLNPYIGPTNIPSIELMDNIYARHYPINISSFNNDLVLSKEASALFQEDDLRRNFMSRTPLFVAQEYPDGRLRRIGPMTVQIGVTLADLYLLRAECKARLNDLAGAKADVEFLRKNRMPAASVAVPANIASQRISLLKFILEERIREFAGQGYRWFDMRRLSVDPLFSNVTYKHQVFDMDGKVVETFPLKPERFTLQLPPKVIDLNPGMENNP